MSSDLFSMRVGSVLAILTTVAPAFRTLHSLQFMLGKYLLKEGMNENLVKKIDLTIQSQITHSYTTGLYLNK
jgi:hypothetical protein